MLDSARKSTGLDAPIKDIELQKEGVDIDMEHSTQIKT